MTREENSFRAREMREAICRWLLFEIFAQCDLLRQGTICRPRRSNRQENLPAEDETVASLIPTESQLDTTSELR
jgi:hypothetical protein